MSDETLRIARESYDACIEGKDGVRDVYGEWFSGPWARALTIEVNHLVDVDDERALTLLTLGGEGLDSGHVRRAHLLHFRDGPTSRTEAYGTWEEGLQAAGLDCMPD